MGTVVRAPCSDYDRGFTADHWYSTGTESSAAIPGAASNCDPLTKTKAQWEAMGVNGAPDVSVPIEVFPTWGTVCNKDMADNLCSSSTGGKGGADVKCANVASRNSMMEALTHAQCAYFVAIVIVQWADLIILGTRPLKFLHWMPGIPYSIF